MAETKTKRGSIDAHSHWAPPGYIAYAKNLPGSIGGTDQLMHDLEARMRWMDSRNVQMHVLTLSGAMPWQWVAQDDAVNMARIVNDAGIAAHKAHPDRFVFGAAMPMRDPGKALAELDRIAGSPGLRAIHLPNSVEGIDYVFGAEYRPLLARCEELGLPILFHPLDGAANIHGGPDRLGMDFIWNSLGFPFETATLATKFILTGTLDRFPKLDVLLPHAGGCFPYVVGRIEHSISKGVVEGAKTLARPFRDYIRRFHYDSLAYRPETLRFMIEIVGADRVVIGTDNYATMDVQWPNELTESLGLAPADLEGILHGNAARLLRLNG